MSVEDPTVVAREMEGETFRNIQGFAGYQISNLFRVRSCWWLYGQRRRTMLPQFWHLVATTLTVDGRYYTVMMFNDEGNPVRHYVHHLLVKEKFLSPMPVVPMLPIPDDPMIVTHAQDGEQFRDIAGCHGYIVSNFGRVGSCWWIHGWHERAILPVWHLVSASPAIHNRYFQVSLTNDAGKEIKRLVHILVAKAFLGPIPDGMEVCHWDNNGQNNVVSNLRYDTHKGNMADKVRHGTENKGSRNGQAFLTENQVHEIRRRLAAGERQWVIASDFDVSESYISCIKRGKSWSHLL